MLAAGLAGGLAIMTKQVAVWNLLALFLCLAWQGRRGSVLQDGVCPGAILAAGAAAAVLATLMPFILARSLGDFYEIAVRDGWLYVSNVTFMSRLSGAGRLTLQLLATAPFVFAAAAGLRRSWPPRTRLALVLVSWCAGSLLGVASGGRFFPHYYIQLLPALALLSAPVLHAALLALRSGSVSYRGPVLVALLLAPCLFFNLGVYLRMTPESRHIAKFPDTQARAAIDARALAVYVRSHTAPGDVILNWGREAQIYFYAHRRPASKYLADWSFWDAPPTFTRAMVYLIARPPVLILDTLPPPGLRESWSKYHPPAFVSLLDREYEYVGKVYFAHVYRLKSSRGWVSQDYTLIEDEYAFSQPFEGR
jgi:4-amino-4-deoxy-L-arabinose transferase-like glycosyltransferase